MTTAERFAAAQAVGDKQDWLSRSAQDMVRIAAFAGFDIDALLRRVATSTPVRGRVVNVNAVLRVMGEMSHDD